MPYTDDGSRIFVTLRAQTALPCQTDEEDDPPTAAASAWLIVKVWIILKVDWCVHPWAGHLDKHPFIHNCCSVGRSRGATCAWSAAGMGTTSARCLSVSSLTSWRPVRARRAGARQSPVSNVARSDHFIRGGGVAGGVARSALCGLAGVPGIVSPLAGVPSPASVSAPAGVSSAAVGSSNASSKRPSPPWPSSSTAKTPSSWMLMLAGAIPGHDVNASAGASEESALLEIHSGRSLNRKRRPWGSINLPDVHIHSEGFCGTKVLVSENARLSRKEPIVSPATC